MSARFRSAKIIQLLYQLWRRFAEEGMKDIPKLVLAGARGWLTQDLLHQIEHDPLVKESIVILHGVDDRQLNWLYSNCLFTLYPSLYEGWGLPIVESLQHGKPCIASTTSSMPEAGQGLAKHCDPYDFKAWYETILHWHRDRHALAHQAQRIAYEFKSRSWDDFRSDFFASLGQLSDAQALARRAA